MTFEITYVTPILDQIVLNERMTEELPSLTRLGSHTSLQLCSAVQPAGITGVLPKEMK